MKIQNDKGLIKIEPLADILYREEITMKKKDKEVKLMLRPKALITMADAERFLQGSKESGINLSIETLRLMIKDSDLYNAVLLSKYHGNELKWLGDKNGWWVFEQGKWIKDIFNKRITLARNTAFKIAETDIEWGMESTRTERLNAMIKTLEPYWVKNKTDFDKKDFLFNCADGTIDLETGKLKEFDPNDFMTKISQVKFNDNVTGTLWEAFLKRFIPNKEKREFIKRAAGQALIGRQNEKTCIFLLGAKDSGKSTFLEILRWILGDYAKLMDKRTILRGWKSNISTDIVRLEEARFVTFSEIEEGDKLDAGKFKAMTGQQSMVARGLRSTEIEYRAKFQLMMDSNAFPEVMRDDQATWRRILVCRFDETIPENEIDRSYFFKLQEEGSGILGWLVKGCLEYQSMGLAVPGIIREETEKEYQEQKAKRSTPEETVIFWIEQCCYEYNLAYRAPFEKHWDSYKAFCDRLGEGRMSVKMFSQTLIKTGKVIRAPGKPVWLIGLYLKQTESEVRQNKGYYVGFDSNQEQNPKMLPTGATGLIDLRLLSEIKKRRKEEGKEDNEKWRKQKIATLLFAGKEEFKEGE